MFLLVMQINEIAITLANHIYDPGLKREDIEYP